MHAAIDFILKIDERLFSLAETYGAWVYGILFLIVFAETGLIVAPILPGDSLLFAAGALCGAGLLNPWIMATLLIAAAIIGDAVNYSVGRSLGPKVFSAHDHSSRLHRLLNREHLDKAHAFFEKHGGKALILARFVPIIRTFVPVIVGVAQMDKRKFFLYNVIGAVLWGGGVTLLGAWLGQFSWVGNNIDIIFILIVFISIIPILVELLKASTASKKKKNAQSPVIED